MKILFLYEVNCGGETVAVTSIINELINTRNASLIHHPQLPLSKTGFQSFFGWIVISVYHWLGFMINNRNADWVYTTTFTAGVAAVVLKSFFRFRLVWHYHGTRVPLTAEGLKGKTFLSQKIKRAIVILFHKFFLDRTDLIIVPGSTTKTKLLEEFPYLHKKMIRVIPNGVDIKMFKPVSVPEKKKLLHDLKITGHPVILWLGRLNIKKGLNLLLRVITELKKDLPDLILILAHPKIQNPYEFQYKQQLLTLITKLKIQNNIYWLTDYPVPNLYNISELVVSLSEIELFQLILLEALATKTLFMGRPVGETARILKGVDQRLIIKSMQIKFVANQIRAILKLSNAEKKAIVERGYKLTRKYSWSKTTKNILRSLTSIPS